MNAFDPMTAAADWLRYYRHAAIEPLLALYDDEAVVECDYGGQAIIVGKAAIGEYWMQRLSQKPAFGLKSLEPEDGAVTVNYLTQDGVVRATLHFNGAGKIERSRCAPVSGMRDAQLG
jgi:hypothetical protein